MKPPSIVTAALVAVSLTVSTFAQNINTSENFPDPDFRAVVESFIGVPPGGAFTAADAAARTGWIECAGCNITDITGLAHFTSISGLYCHGNELIRVDVSKNTALQFLSCADDTKEHAQLVMTRGKDGRCVERLFFLTNTHDIQIRCFRSPLAP